MVIDAEVIVSQHNETTPNTIVKEHLFPMRHQLTLPLNSLNNYFQNCEVAFNYHTKLDCDR